MPRQGQAMVQSEQERGEPRFYWVGVYDGKSWRNEGTEGEGTSAKHRCEQAAARINAALDAKEHADG